MFDWFVHGLFCLLARSKTKSQQKRNVYLFFWYPRTAVSDLNQEHCINVSYSLQLRVYLITNINIMTKKRTVLLPKSKKLLDELGENIQLARLRRKLSSEQVAERAGISRPTLVKIEGGHPGVSIGNLLNVLLVLGLEKDLLLVAKDDLLGRKLQDAQLTVSKRAPKKKED